MYLPDHYVVGKYCRHCVAAGRNSATVGGGGETLSPSTDVEGASTYGGRRGRAAHGPSLPTVKLTPTV